MWNNMKTFLLLAALTAMLVGAGQVLAGRGGMALGLAAAIVLNFVSYWFSDKIALSMSGARAVAPHQAPWLHQAAHMHIVNPLTAGETLASLFSTHPPTAERVRREALDVSRLVP